MTKEGAILRGNLYIAIAIIGTILTDEQILPLLPLWVRAIGRAVFIGVTTYRVYIDGSHEQAKQAEQAKQNPPTDDEQKVSDI